VSCRGKAMHAWASATATSSRLISWQCSKVNGPGYNSCSVLRTSGWPIPVAPRAKSSRLCYAIACAG
jgi:hypothetical protein